MHYIALLVLFSLLGACEQNQKHSEVYNKNAAVALMDLANLNACTQCHKLNVPFRAPSWIQIAQRYPNSAIVHSQLVNKTMRGGGGNWTRETGGAQMPAQSPRVSNQHIEQMINSLLSLDE